MKSYFESRISNFNQNIEAYILDIVRKDDSVFENNKNNEYVSLFKEYTDEGEYKAYCVISTDVTPNLWLGVRNIKNRCESADVPFFFKQWGGKNNKKSGRLLNGRTYDEMPK